MKLNKKAFEGVPGWILLALALLLVVLLIYGAFSGTLSDIIPSFSFFG